MRSTAFSNQFSVIVFIFFAPEFCRFQLGLDQRQQLFERHRADVFGVHPERLVVGPVTRIVLVKIEDGVRAMNAVEREFLDQLVERIDLLFLARRPAKQREEIAKRRGKKPASR